MENLKSFWVSYDNDGIVQFWKNRPVYHEGSDEFEGDEIVLDEQLRNYLLKKIPERMDFGNSEKFYFGEGGFFRLSDIKHLDREDTLYALSWDFRRVVNSIGEVDYGNKNFYPTNPVVLDISDLNIAVIEDFDGGVPVCSGYIRKIAVDNCLDNNVQEGDAFYEEPDTPSIDWTDEELEQFKEEGDIKMLVRKKSIKDDEFGEDPYDCYSAICEFEFECFDKQARYSIVQNVDDIASEYNTDDINGLIELRNWLWRHIISCDKLLDDPSYSD